MTRLLRIFVLNIILLACVSTTYAQVVVSSGDSVSSVQIDYAHPQIYEIGGITTSGTGGLDRRFLTFQVGESVEIPGEKISKTLKKLWSTGLYEDIRINVTKVVGNTAFIDIYLEDRSRLAAFAF
ncbi:MAG: hypothetical protein MJZ49_08115, partial [Bacteroidales bacterium]|nr:hypothetical protein [Bacteroidales bacterium]